MLALVLLLPACGTPERPVRVLPAENRAERGADVQVPAEAPPRMQRRIVLGRIEVARPGAQPVDPEAQAHVAYALTVLEAFSLELRPDITPAAAEQGQGAWRVALAGRDALVVGTVEELPAQAPPAQTLPPPVSLAQTALVRLTLRAYDPLTGQRLLSITSVREAATYGGALGLASFDTAYQLEERWAEQPWQAAVLAIEGDRLRLSAGEAQGLHPGMTLELQTQGDRIRSRSSGLLLILPGRPLGRLRVEADGSARLVSGSLAGHSAAELMVRLPAPPASSLSPLFQPLPRKTP